MAGYQKIEGQKPIASALENERRAVMDFITILFLLTQIVKIVTRMGDDAN